MPSFNPRAVYTIAKKEFLDHIRNRWIILLTVLLFVLVIVFSYLAGGQTGGTNVFGNMQNTVFGLLSISAILIPLIAIILGFSTISGEAESGALYIVHVLSGDPVRGADRQTSRAWVGHGRRSTRGFWLWRNIDLRNRWR